MDVSYRQLKIFLALAETKNATRAAERVHLTQSAVSQAIKKLNAQLACELFLRQQNEFLLTDAGKSLYQEASIMVAKLSQLRAHNLAKKKDFSKPFRSAPSIHWQRQLSPPLFLKPSRPIQGSC